MTENRTARRMGSLVGTARLFPEADFGSAVSSGISLIFNLFNLENVLGTFQTRRHDQINPQ
jgi:hypothetical protein